MKKLAVVLMVVSLFSLMTAYTAFASEEDAQAPDVVYENDFEDLNMGMEVGTAFDAGTIGWKGNAHVTWDEASVINGSASAHFWINTTGAWHKAGQISLPGTESAQYTFRMKYRWLSTDVEQFGIVKFADSNRGVAFDGALENPPDSSSDGINWAHNGGHADLAYAKSNDLGNGVRELIFVQTCAAGDVGLYFSAGDGGAEYIVDDIVVTKGDTRDAATAPIVKTPVQAGTLKSEKTFEDSSMEAFQAESGVTLSVDEQQPISGDKSLMASVATADPNVTKKFTYTPDAQQFRKGQYYTLSLKVKSNGVSEMYIKGVTDVRSDPLHEAVIRFVTGQHMSSYSVDRLRVDYVKDSHNQITYGFCYDDAQSLSLEIWFNSDHEDAWLMFDDIEIVEGASSYYSITTRADAEEGGTVTGGGIYRLGETVAFTAEANEGYVFAGWYNDKELVSEESRYEFKASGSMTLAAKFELQTFTVTVEQAENGSIAPQTQECAYGSDLTLTFTPNAGYRVEAIIVDGEEIEGALSYTLENIVGPHTVTARFSLIEHAIQVNPADGVTLIPGDGYTLSVKDGGDFKFTVQVADGYDASNMVVKAGSFVLTADSNGVYTIENITSDKTIVITGVVKAGGSANTDDDTTAGCGGSVAFGSIAASVAVCSVAFCAFKKRREK